MDRNNLTEGVIWKKLAIYFLPIVAGTLFQQLYNAVDAIVVSKYVGTDALAAVGGSAGNLTQLLVNLFVALAGGATVIIAQYYGAKDYEKVNKSMQTAIAFCIIGGLAMSAVVVWQAPNLLVMMKTPADTLQQSAVYMRIYFSGSLFTLLFNMGSGILRAMGDSRRPFIFLFISCGTNIVLDLLFVIRFGLGVAGVAWATVIAQAISAVLIMIVLARGDGNCRLEFGTVDFKGNLLRRMMRIGIPAMLQSAMYGVSNLILQVGINTLGKIVVASWAMSGKLDGVYWSTATAAGIAITNFVGQNYGAGRIDRIKECTRVSFKMFIGVTLALSAAILLVARPLLGVFTDDPEVISTTWYIVRFFVPTYFIWSIIEILSGVLRGVGDAINPVIIIGICVCALRMVWVYTVFMVKPTLTVLCMIYPISWLVTDIVMGIYYAKGSKVKKLSTEALLNER